MSLQYRQFLKILEKWTVDKNKQGRDIAERLRTLMPLKQEPTWSPTTEQTEYLNLQIEALGRLSKNIYFSKYDRVHLSTATGLSAKQCSQVLSSEFLQYLKEQKN